MSYLSLTLSTPKTIYLTYARNFASVLLTCFKNIIFCLSRISVVESIPEGLIFNDSSRTETHLRTYNSWLTLIQLAKTEIDIGSYYWSLQEKHIHDPTTAQVIYDGRIR